MNITLIFVELCHNYTSYKMMWFFFCCPTMYADFLTLAFFYFSFFRASLTGR